MGNTRIDERMKKEKLPSATIYHHDGGELFAEDVDQHMAVLPEVGTPTQEIRISKWAIQMSQGLMIKRSCDK